MATSFFITIRDAQLYNSRAVPREGVIIPEQTKIECDWLWNSGVLFGKRKVVTPLEYANLFVNDSDLEPFVEVPPSPISLVYPPGAFELRLIQPNGEIVIARNTTTITLTV